MLNSQLIEMRLGILRSFVGYNEEDLADIEKACTQLGLDCVHVIVDNLLVEVFEGGVVVRYGRRMERLDLDLAWVRGVGIVRDFEQFTYRIGTLIALEKAGVRVFNPPIPWLIASDKFLSSLILSKSGVPIPRTIATENIMYAYSAGSTLGKFVVKPLRSSGGYGSLRFENVDEAMHLFSMMANLNKPMLLQKYLPHEFDVRVVAVGGEVLGAMARICRNDWRCNVARGGEVRKIEADPEVVEVSIRAVESLGLDYGGVDLVFDEGKPVVLEVNPVVSWQGFKRAVGVNPALRILDYEIKALKR